MPPKPESPQPPPGGWLALSFPDHFALDVKTSQGWINWASYASRNVSPVQDQENVWVAANGGMPIYFRCVEKRGSEFDSIAGTGEVITYRFVPLDPQGKTLL